MPKILALPGLLIILLAVSAVACASLSIDDYAEECGEWNDDYGVFGSGISSVRDFEDAREDWNALAPPSEVKGLHEVVAESLKLTMEIAGEQEALEEDLYDLMDELEELHEELDDAPRRRRDGIRDQIEDIQDDIQDEQEDRYEDLEDVYDRLEDLGDEYEDEKDDLPRRVRRDLEDEGCIY